MPAKVIQPGSPDPEEYELLSRDHSLDQANGVLEERPISLDDPYQEIHHRQGRSQSHSEGRRRPEEVVGLLDGGSWTVKRKLRITGGLGTALELISQSAPSLLAAVIGSAMTGVVFDQVQYWPAFVRIGELFILVPVLLNLKGCLEMNLASRLSTSANIGELDIKQTRKAIVLGNLALLQVQTLIIGAAAGLLAFILGYFTRPHRETWFESALMIVSAMLGASLSSVVLSTFTSALILLSRRFRLNPDNIATPLASSFGDLITLIILTFLASLLVNVIKTYWATALLVILSLILPGFILLVWRNPYVSELLFEGWTATFLSMIISSGSGVVLQSFVNQYDALPLILPVTSALAGNVGCIFASRLSTSFHAHTDDPPSSIFSRNHLIVEGTLFFISLPIHLAFLGFVRILGIFHFGVGFLFAYLVMGGISIASALALAYSISRVCWTRGYNPDNFVMGLISAITDVIVTTLLVIIFKIST